MFRRAAYLPLTGVSRRVNDLLSLETMRHAWSRGAVVGVSLMLRVASSHADPLPAAPPSYSPAQAPPAMPASPHKAAGLDHRAVDLAACRVVRMASGPPGWPPATAWRTANDQAFGAALTAAGVAVAAAATMVTGSAAASTGPACYSPDQAGYMATGAYFRDVDVNAWLPPAPRGFPVRSAGWASRWRCGPRPR